MVNHLVRSAAPDRNYLFVFLSDFEYDFSQITVLIFKVFFRVYRVNSLHGGVKYIAGVVKNG